MRHHGWCLWIRTVHGIKIQSNQSLIERTTRGTIAIAVCSSLLWAETARGDASGLNNIPTADTTAARFIVLQFRSDLRDESHAMHRAGFKMGLEPLGQRFEWGVDGLLGVGSIGADGGPGALQFKLALDFTESTALGVGVANIGLREQDRDEIGQPFKYAVVSHDLGPIRAHGGYGLQQGGNTALLGVDRTVELFDRNLTLRADFIQIDDEEQWLGSVGFLYEINDHFAIESWMSQPFDNGEPIFTIKLDLAFSF